MSKPRIRNVGLAGVIMSTMAATFVLPEAWQQKPSPSSTERAQDQPFPPGSPFALLPGFKIDRVTPPEKTESYIVVTFDPRDGRSSRRAVRATAVRHACSSTRTATGSSKARRSSRAS